ncbi:MAG: hypothetical protein V4596_02195 [Bdellovibrionota bacterium]
MKMTAFILGILVLAGCNEQLIKQQHKSPENLEAVSFRDINQMIIQPFRCTECHGDSGAPKGISLTSFAAVMASATVDLDNPTASKLFTALDSGMMPGNGRISQEQIDLVRLWIEQGANP